MIEIRGMRWWDIDAVHAIEESSFPVDRWSVEQFWGELAQSTRHYVVACEGDEVVGYAGAFILAPDSDVQTIAVAESARGQGVGRLLMDELLRAARAAGCTQMMLEVREDATAATALYTSLGFEVVSRRRDYYAPGSDALIMRRRPLAEAP